MSDWVDPLWVDNRASVKGAGTHALIVGTSYYPFLKGGNNYPPDFDLSIDLRQVSIAATGAWKLANWLKSLGFSQNAKAQLATIRLLISPSEEERQQFPELLGLDPKHCITERESVRRALLEWKKDCAKNRDSVAIFYVSGHGVARSRLESYVLLQDFPKDEQAMLYCIDPRGVRDGMTGDNIARTQFYFIDACRDNLEEFQKFKWFGDPVRLNEEYEGLDERVWSMYFSTSPARKAYGTPGGGTFFSAALMDCLDGPSQRALSPPAEGASLPEQRSNWNISNLSLGLSLKSRVDEIVAEYNKQELAAAVAEGTTAKARKQTVLPEGVFNPMLLSVWPQPPKLFIHIHVEPEDRAMLAKATLQDLGNTVIFQGKDCVPRPLKFEDLSAVPYLLEIETQPGGQRKGPMLLTPKLPGIEHTVEF